MHLIITFQQQRKLVPLVLILIFSPIIWAVLVLTYLSSGCVLLRLLVPHPELGRLLPERVGPHAKLARRQQRYQNAGKFFRGRRLLQPGLRPPGGVSCLLLVCPGGARRDVLRQGGSRALVGTRGDTYVSKAAVVLHRLFLCHSCARACCMPCRGRLMLGAFACLITQLFTTYLAPSTALAHVMEVSSSSWLQVRLFSYVCLLCALFTEVFVSQWSCFWFTELWHNIAAKKLWRNPHHVSHGWNVGEVVKFVKAWEPKNSKEAV